MVVNTRLSLERECRTLLRVFTNQKGKFLFANASTAVLTHNLLSKILHLSAKHTQLLYHDSLIKTDGDSEKEVLVSEAHHKQPV